MQWACYVVQAATAGILLVAANTSFADFPRLASLTARDRFVPNQFAHLGDRLVFNNGIIALALFAAVLVFAFGGDTSRLIPLYAVGVFLSFTLSQAGMVVHWWHQHQRDREGPRHESVESPGRGWKRSIVISALGASATALVVVIFVLTKFIHGAWIVVVLIPVLVLLFRAIHKHYENLDQQLQLRGIHPVGGCRSNTLVLPVTGVHPGVATALEFAKCLSREVHAVYVKIDPAQTPALREDWAKLETDVPIEVVPSRYRSWVGVLIGHIHEIRARHANDLVTVILPEFVPSFWWQELSHNQSILRLKASLLYRPGIVVVSVPYLLVIEPAERVS